MPRPSIDDSTSGVSCVMRHVPRCIRLIAQNACSSRTGFRLCVRLQNNATQCTKMAKAEQELLVEDFVGDFSTKALTWSAVENIIDAS
jgi:hypothetical protein